MKLSYILLAVVSGIILLGILLFNWYEPKEGPVIYEPQDTEFDLRDGTPVNEREIVKDEEEDIFIVDGEDVTPSVTTESIINLSGKGLNTVPKVIFTQTGTQKLDLSHNNLEGALPAEVRHLSELRILDLSDNNFTGVPAEVGQLTRLEILDLSNNQLTGLPYEIGNLKNLKLLDISGNEYSMIDLEHIKADLPATTRIVTE